jgi:hypothetical protein
MYHDVISYLDAHWYPRLDRYSVELESVEEQGPDLQ